jgi:hypothetical protein
MKTNNFKLITLWGIAATVIALHSCKLDPPIYPSKPITTATGAEATDPDMGYNLMVTTFKKEISEPKRIGSDAFGNFFVSNNRGQVIKIDAKGDQKILCNDRNDPEGVKTDIKGNVYIALAGENKIVKISPEGNISNIAISLALNKPKDIALLPDGTLFIADTDNRRILRIAPNGQASVFAGKTGVFGIKDGKGEQAHFSYPTNIRVGSNNTLWIVDGNGINKKTYGQTIRRISISGNVTTLFKQNNTGITILDLAISKMDKNLKSADLEALFILKSDNTISYLTLNGKETNLNPNSTIGYIDGNLDEAKFNKPSGITIRDKVIYIADYSNNAIRKICGK